MLKTEESKIGIVILLTFALLIVSGIFEAYVVWATVATLALLIIFWVYALLSKKRYGETQDERTAKCSLMAARNGFVVATILIALVAATSRMGATYDPINLVQIVWGFGVMTYMLSYLYYKRVV